MKKMFNLFFIAIIGFVLAGCVSNPSKPETKIEYRTQSMLMVMPDHLLPNCLQPVPPTKEKYNAASNSEKEKLLIEYSEGLIQSVTACNNTIDSARKWNAKQKELFIKKSKDNLIKELNE